MQAITMPAMAPLLRTELLPEEDWLDFLSELVDLGDLLGDFDAGGGGRNGGGGGAGEELNEFPPYLQH